MTPISQTPRLLEARAFSLIFTFNLTPENLLFRNVLQVFYRHFALGTGQ